MTLEWLAPLFTVCQLDRAGDADLSVPFTFLSRTDGEISLVCPTEHCPPTARRREDGWRCFRVKGPLDFSLVGVLAGITGRLAAKGIPVFAVSTYDTDYVLVKAADREAAAEALQSPF